jgi:hypothetical protein
VILVSSLPEYQGAVREAVKFGIHEVVLNGDGCVANAFDTAARVTFTPASGNTKSKTVYAFYDGDNTWRARVYVSEPGAWRWSSACATDKRLDGQTGSFDAVDSKLRGRLLPHPKNPRYWMTEDGWWFLNIIDTAYFLLSPYDENGEPIRSEDVAAYVRDAVDHGITSFFSYVVSGPRGCFDDGAERWPDAYFEDAGFTRPRLDHFRCSDRRLEWLLEHYPDEYVELILFPRGSPWGADEQFWKKLSPAQKERVLRYIVARYAAYPQVFWLAINDAHYGPDYPNNNAFVREVGAYFRKNDPWQHPMSTGPARFVDFYFPGEDWVGYVHLENEYDVGASQHAKYDRYAKPVLLGEDRYEQDQPNRDPTDMRYFQRRLCWAWLLSGGSANYCGRWWVVHPYSQTGKRSTTVNYHGVKTFTKQLVGLDSVRYIRDYFTTRRIELPDFQPDRGLLTDLDGRAGAQAPKLMRRGYEEFLIYHPNAASDGKESKVDASGQARLRLDLRAAVGRFSVEWYRAEDGAAHDGGTVDGGRETQFVAPWAGQDVVLRLVKAPVSKQ